MLNPSQASVDEKYTTVDYKFQQVHEITELGFFCEVRLYFDSHYTTVPQKATILMYNIIRRLSTRNPLFLLQAYVQGLFYTAVGIRNCGSQLFESS